MVFIKCFFKEGFFNECKWYYKVHKGSSKVCTYELPHMHHEYVASAYITWHRGIILIYSVSKYRFDWWVAQAHYKSLYMLRSIGLLLTTVVVLILRVVVVENNFCVYLKKNTRQRMLKHIPTIKQRHAESSYFVPM